MTIYRLDPLDPGHRSWTNSDEKDSVWASAETPEAARELVADKTKLGDEDAGESPWRLEAVTSCVVEPTMTHVDAGTVVRGDGSLVER